MKQEVEDEEHNTKEYNEWLENENRIRQENFEKHIHLQNCISRQLLDQIEERRLRREADMDDEIRLAESNERSLLEEKRKEEENKHARQEFAEQGRREYEVTLKMRERKKAIEEAEDAKLRQLEIENMENEERRRIEEERRKMERTKLRMKLIQAQAERLKATKQEQEDFFHIDFSNF
jgi:hypothetical protein